MQTIDLFFLLPSAAAIISFAVIMIMGKHHPENKRLQFLKIVPVLSVIALIFGVFYVTSHYQSELEKEKQQFQLLRKQVQINDSILSDQQERQLIMDSLSLQNKELTEMLRKMDKQKSITGNQSDFREEVQTKIIENKQQIQKMAAFPQVENETTD